MNEVERIADQLHRAYWGEAWHGPSLKEVLTGVSAVKASKKPIKKGHSIWEITLHANAWLEAVRRRVEGEQLNLTDEQDWPKFMKTGPKAWSATLAMLEETQKKLEETIQGLTDAKLAEKIAGGSQTVYFQLHGIIQHTLYHAGQIAVLKKG